MVLPKRRGPGRYDAVYFATIGGRPATLERYLEGQCCKYVVNNNGICPTNEDQLDDLFEKAQTLTHFTWLVSDR